LEKQADLSIILMATQGNIATAQDIIQQRLDLEFGPAEEQIQLGQMYLQILSPLLEREDRQQAQELNLFYQERERLLQEERSEKEMRYGLATQLADAGNPTMARQVLAGQISIGEAMVQAGTARFRAGQSLSTKPMTNPEMDEFERAFGWRPAPGVSREQAIAYMQANPNLEPEQLEQELKNALSGRRDTLGTVDDVVSTIQEITGPMRNMLAAIADRFEPTKLSRAISTVRSDKKKVERLLGHESIRERIRLGLLQSMTAEQIAQTIIAENQ
jgi:hypothetical protein